MINWKYIKGLNEDSSNPEGTSLYSFINFQHKQQEDVDFIDQQHIPEIYINDSNNIGNYNAGHIITQKAKNQTIEKEISFGEGWRFLQLKDDQENTFTCHSSHDSVSFYLKIDAHWPSYYEDEPDHTIEWHTPYTSGGTINRPRGYIITDSDVGIGTIGSPYTVWFNSDPENSDDAIAIFHGNVEVYNGYVNASYFNATSDRRAKDNLKILNFKALDLINHTNLYSFTYKDTNTPSIGIIAQDVQNVNIEGFKLVDNENATGEDMDYMSIHESKLVYILWQAIKEQQKEIEELKKRLN